MAFTPNASHSVLAVAVQADGRILVGGTFQTIAGVARYLIARLNTDGTADIGFNTILTGGWVDGFTFQPGGTIYITGSFGAVNGVDTPFYAWLNADGTLNRSYMLPASTGSVNPAAF